MPGGCGSAPAVAYEASCQGGGDPACAAVCGAGLTGPLARPGSPERLCLLVSVHDLRQQMTALQSQLQQVQLERTTLTSKLKASQAEIASLQSVRQWYQQQLALAQEARVRLQGEMAHIQVQPLPWPAAHAAHLVWNTCFFPKLKRLF